MSTENKYKNIFQSINVGIIIVADSVGDIIEWNKGAELAFGHTSAEIIGKSLTVLISKKQVENGIKELLKAKDQLDNDAHGENIEMLALRKNGEEFPVELAVSHWQNGSDKFYCALMLDITKRRKLEERLTQTTKDLEVFLYRSAHDLKAPLTSAEGLLQLLKEEKLNEQATQLVDMLDDTLEKGRLLLDDLTFASIISEKRRDVSKIDFQNKINNAVVALKGSRNFDAITFHINTDQTTDFYFNQELIDSILQNLIHNAICFAKPKTEIDTPHVEVHVKVTNQNVHITVTDNGMGISKSHIDKVFDLYFRVCSEKSNGAGLGLYIVKRIADDLNGGLKVTSEINNGASFEVCLPNLIEENLNDD